MIRSSQHGCRIGVALLAGVSGACAKAHDRTPAALSERDSAGVHMVRLESFNAVSAPAWTSTVLYTTEGIDSLALQQGFVLPAHALFARDTSLLISNGVEVMVLRPDGSAAPHLGRKGDGPGEFRSIFTLGAGADGSVFTTDFSGRLSQFKPNREVMRTVSHLDEFGGREPELLTILTDGRILVVPWQWRPNRNGLHGITGGPFERDSVPLLVYNGDGKVTETVAVWPGLERSKGLPVRFARSVVYDGRGDATVLGVSDSLDLSLFRGTDLKLRLIAPSDGRPPSRQQRADWDSALVREMPDDGRGLVKVEDAAGDVPALPGIGGVVLDDAGNIWIGAYATAGERSRRWHIFDPTGRPIGILDLPALNEAFVPSQTELLDVACGRIALLRENQPGELIVEVRVIHRMP